jgi:hypothetical protein
MTVSHNTLISRARPATIWVSFATQAERDAPWDELSVLRIGDSDVRLKYHHSKYFNIQYAPQMEWACLLGTGFAAYAVQGRGSSWMAFATGRNFSAYNGSLGSRYTEDARKEAAQLLDRYCETNGVKVEMTQWPCYGSARIDGQVSTLPPNSSSLKLEEYHSDMWRRVALVRTDVLWKHFASIIRVTRIGELGTTWAATSGRNTQYFFSVFLSC